MFVSFTVVTYETKQDYKEALQNLQEANRRITDLEALIIEENLKRKQNVADLSDSLMKHSDKIVIIEESLDPANTRWAKIKKVREAVQKTFEEFRYPKNMTTLQTTAYASAVVDYSEQFDVPIPLILAMSRQESAFNPKAQSYANAMGVIQIIPSTAREIAVDLGVRHYSMFKIRDNVHFGVYYIMKMLDEFDGDVQLAVRAYNCGPTYVRKVVSGDYTDYPAETKDYVKRILGSEIESGFIQYYEKMGL